MVGESFTSPSSHSAADSERNISSLANPDVNPLANNVLPHIRDAVVGIFERVGTISAKDACSFASSCNFLNQTFKEPSVMRVINLSAFVKRPIVIQSYPTFFESAINSGNPTALYLRGMSRITAANDIEGSLRVGYVRPCIVADLRYGLGFQVKINPGSATDRVFGWRATIEHMIFIGEQNRLRRTDNDDPVAVSVATTPTIFRRQAMIRFPDRLFALGNEPANKKVNTYFQLPYLDTISHALEEDHMEKLSLSQFGKLIEAGNKISSSVRFLHFILSRQLVTKKKELWCLFAGQRIHFSIREFAITTGLDCSNLPPPKKLKEDKVNEYTIELFGAERNATPGWIETTLAGRPYKDKATRFKLACLLLIDGIVCPTSKNAKISAEHIMLVQDVDKFLEYPWGRKSFDLTIHSIKIRIATKLYLCQPTCAFQGFLHGLQMVVLECAPSILKKNVKGKSTKHTLRDDDDEEEFPSIRTGSMKPINISMPHVKSLDNNQKVAVTAILPNDEHLLDDTDLEFDDDVSDETVANLLAAINEGHKFSRKTWNGGEKASLHQNQPKAPASSSRNTSSDVDLDPAASSILEKVERDNALVSSSEESKSSDSSKDDDGDDGTKSKDPSSPSTESDDGEDSNVGDVVEIDDGDDHEDRREADAEGSGDAGDVGSQMPVDVDDVQDDATLASNQIASVLSDLSEKVQVNVEASRTQPVSSPLPHVNLELSEIIPMVSENESGSVSTRQMENDGANDQTGAEKDVPPVVTNNQTGAVQDVPPVDTNDQTGAEQNVPPVETNDQTGAEKEVPPESQVLGEDVTNAQKEIDIPAGVDPPVWSLGLTQEEKNMAQTSQKGAEEQGAIRKSKRLPVPSSQMTDFIVPRPKHANKTEKSVDLLHLFSTPNFEQVILLQNRMKDTRNFPSWDGIVLFVNILKEIVDLKFPISVMSIDSIIRLFRHQLAELNDVRCTYDFVEYTFLHGIVEILPQFTNPPKRKLVSLPPGSAAYVKARRSWYTQVARIYCPYQVDDQYWVGLCIDFESHKIMVLNAYATLKEMKLKTSVAPLAQSLPHFIKRVAYNTEMKADDITAFTIKNFKPMFQTSALGYLGVLALMSIQLHAANMPLDYAVGDDVVRDASLKFAYDLLCLIEPPSLADVVIRKDPAA
ncbi:uncharacterized protein LOC112084612 [Eutrema salsugineum]|uniref:uncharacterized protein LOC112084612 n=1 Tax=Eutrema salsugineum TaxID=72664 RepID=UPI000CED4CF7|nr:uncharacterized protein LOC112084612 [Eutrema salsugineum]